jgi:hypothetical protein
MLKSPTPFAGVPSALSPLGKDAWSFDGVLRRVLGLSRAAELERKPRREAKVGSTATDALRIFARSLDADALKKLETLMRAGREARALGAASAAISARTAARPPESTDLFDDQSASVENLCRGHAIACATRFDLESEVTGWPDSLAGDSLDERVWLRFGKELASSSPSDWACLAEVGKNTELQTLYLRRGDGVWWSFDKQIDRPSSRFVMRRLEAPRSRRDRLVTLPLDAVVGRRCRSDRAALRRAAMAMSARLGACRGT